MSFIILLSCRCSQEYIQTSQTSTVTRHMLGSRQDKKNFSPSLFNDIACYSWALAKMLGSLLHKSLRFQFLQVHLKLCSKKALDIIYAAKLWIQFFDILLLHPFSFLCTYSFCIKQSLGRMSYKSAD